MSNTTFGWRSAPNFHFWLVALFLTLVSMGLQWRGLSGEAVIDDYGWLHDVSQRGCGTDVGECFKHPQLRYYYRPLVAVSFALGERWYQSSADGTPKTFLSKYWVSRWPHSDIYNEALPYHIENLLMHGLAVLLVFWMFRLLFRRDLPALLGGLLFALHPLNVPVTTFIGGRPDTMALIFIILFVIGLLKMQGAAGENQKEGEIPPVGQFPTLTYSALFWLLLSILGFAGALFTKEQCVLLVALAPLLITLARPRPLGRWLGWQSVYALPIAAYVFCAHQVALTVHNEDVVHHDGVRSFFAGSLWSIPLHIEMVGRTCWYYFCSFVFPTVSRMHQSTLGPWDNQALGPLGRNALNVPLPPSPLLAGGGYLALFFALWLLRRTWHDRACRFCLLWLFLTLLPCLNIIPVPSQFVAPYRALIPLVGVCGLAGAFFAYLIEPFLIKPFMAHQVRALHSKHPTNFQGDGVGSWLPLAILVVICGGFVRVTLADVPQWQNASVLMQAELAADPNFVPAKFGEAYLFSQEGKLNEAIASYDAGLRQMLPEAKTIDDCIRAGLAPDMRQRVASATSLRYLDIPYLAGLFRTRGDLKKDLKRWNEAAEDYRVVIALCPRDRSIGNWLAYALDKAGRLQEEETVLKSLIANRADSYRLSKLGDLYFRQKRWDLARDTLALALHSPPSNTDAVADLYTAQQQYNEAFVRALPRKSTDTSTGSP